MIKIILTWLMLTVFFLANHAQQHKVSKVIEKLEWESLQYNVGLNNLPIYEDVYKPVNTFTNVSAFFRELLFEAITGEELAFVSSKNLPTEITLNTEVGYEQKKACVHYSFSPYRINPQSKQIEKVTTFEIHFTFTNSSLKTVDTRIYATNSKLASGNFYKIKVDTTGIFKLTYTQLVQIGLLKPENVRVYSYGGKQLPYSNSDENYDDLKEIPIKLEVGNDGVFNNGDFILFYAEAPVTWNYDGDLDMFIHQKHYYTNYTYLFLSDSEGPGGMKINEINTKNLIPNASSSSYDSYQYHEINKYNLVSSGRTWYGNSFRPGESEDFKFSFSNILPTEKVQIYASVAGRKQKNEESSYFSISNNNNILAKIDISKAYVEYVYGYEFKKYFELNNPANIIDLKFDFIGNDPSMEGYLDYICLNAREKIKQSNSQLIFRDKKVIGLGNITNFNIDNNGKNLTVWNVTNAVDPFEIKLTTIGNTSSFKIQTDTIKQFISFDGLGFFTPILTGNDLGKIENQNLHGAGFYDMVILTHPLFISQANELADFHRTNDSLTVIVVEPQKIYNEFSSGTPDVSAIRNYLRMLYDKAKSPNEMPKYLLLFGDGSYDNLNTSSGNSNFLLTYQSIESLSETSSYVADDFFGLLDIGEGEMQSGTSINIYGLLDIGIGRFPVTTIEEAQLMVDKVKHYTSPASYGDWRTTTTFIADDEDGKLHQNQPEEISNTIVAVNNPEYNISKIFLDLYKQVSTPAGQKHPQVNLAISRQVHEGSLILDYVGHGNPRILATEQILSAPEVNKWKNWDKLTIFVTASCEVGRFDDYKAVSLGEAMLLNGEGGCVAALATTRVVYSGGNHELNKSFFKNVFNTDLRFGDVVKIVKNDRGPKGINHRNFSLLGDPALKIGVPVNKIIINNINDNFLEKSTSNNSIISNSIEPAIFYEPGDTIEALSKVNVQGFITNKQGNAISENGILYITVFDKNETLKIATQDNKLDTLVTNLQNKILYKGKASIAQGVFDFKFIVPIDINYKFGKGKLSLYAILESGEAIGYSENIIIGGNATNTTPDNNGPEIRLYMNDTLFRNGGISNENPVLLGRLIDNAGINTTGNGFGHNIVAIIDGNQDNIITLNNYYEGDLDRYNSGWVIFPFENLDPGYHYIDFKAWDIYNYSTEAQIEFYVYKGDDIIIENLSNYPNPFKNETFFKFEHNLGYETFEININIYDLMGNKVTELKNNNTSSGFSIQPIMWNGTNSMGAKLAKGIYIYRIEIITTDGTKAYKSSKLVIN